MQNSKLLKLLEKFPKKDLVRFGAYLAYSTGKNNKLVIKLYEFIRQNLGKANTSRLSKITAFRHLFDNTEYQDSKIRPLMSALIQYIEEFRAVELIKKDKTTRKKLFIRSLGENNDYRRFEKEVESQIKTVKEVPFKSVDDFQYLTWLHHQLYFHPCTKKFTTKKNIGNLQGLIESQDQYIVFSKLQQAVELQTRQKLFKKEAYQVNFLDEVISVAQKFKDPAKRFGLFRALLNPSEVTDQQFEKIKAYTTFFLSYYAGKAKTIPESDFILFALINFYRSTKKDCRKLLFKLFQFGVEEGLLFENNHLNSVRFNNIVVLGSSNMAFEWTKNFIDQYHHFLPPNEKEKTINLAYAFFYYHLGCTNKISKYLLKAQEFITKIPSPSRDNDIRARSLKFRLVYELELKHKNNLASVLGNAKAFKGFLNRNNELAQKTKDSYSKLIDFAVSLAKVETEINETKARTRLNSIRTDIESTSSIALREWLMQVFTQLEKNLSKPDLDNSIMSA